MPPSSRQAEPPPYAVSWGFMDIGLLRSASPRLSWNEAAIAPGRNKPTPTLNGFSFLFQHKKASRPVFWQQSARIYGRSAVHFSCHNQQPNSATIISVVAPTQPPYHNQARFALPACRQSSQHARACLPNQNVPVLQTALVPGCQ